MTDRQNHASDGLAHLRKALECFQRSGNRRTADRVRKAISSAKGAVRHAGHVDMRERDAIAALETDLWDEAGACPKCQGDGCDPEGGCIYDE